MNGFYELANGFINKHISDGQYIFATKLDNKDENILYYSQNNIGSTTLLTNKDGSDIGQFLYTPFGEMWVEEASTVDISHITRFFTNQQYDKESGLYYYNARYYDPHLGNFITPDPAMDSLNHYIYCNANPIKYIDPTGLMSKEYYKGLSNQELIEKGWEFKSTKELGVWELAIAGALLGAVIGGIPGAIVGFLIGSVSAYALDKMYENEVNKIKDELARRTDERVSEKEKQIDDLKNEMDKAIKDNNLDKIEDLNKQIDNKYKEIIKEKDDLSKSYKKIDDIFTNPKKDKELINEKVKEQEKNDNIIKTDSSNKGDVSSGSDGSIGKTSTSDPWYSSYPTSSWWY